MRARTLASALVALIGSVSARAQSPAPGWILIVRIVPNPLPLGRCAGIQVELQDAQGYRRTELSNGGVIDFHKFRYSVDTTNFQWQNGDPIGGVLCTRPSSPPSTVAVTVTLPDGLAGSADLSTIPPGRSALAVQYPRQGPLKIPGVPPPIPNGRSAAGASTPSASTATIAIPSTDERAVRSSGAVASASKGTAAVASGGTSGGTTVGTTGENTSATSPASSTAHAPALITTSTLTMIGSFAALPPIAVTTSALSFTGGYAASAPISLTTAALTFTGSAVYLAARAPMTVTTAAMTMTGGFAPVSSQLVTTSPLSMVGGFAVLAPQTVNTQALVMIGNGAP